MSEPSVKKVAFESNRSSPQCAATVDAADLVEETVAVFGLDLKVTAWNSEAERVYGWKREEVIGGAIQAAVQCSPSEPLKSILAKVHATGTWRGEFTRTTKNGDTVVVKTKWSLRRDSNGEPVDIVETGREISEVRRTEEALTRVQHQYQNLFQSSAASFFEIEFSTAEKMLRDLAENGVSDLRGYLKANPEYVRHMIRAAPIMEMNEQALSTFGIGQSDVLLDLDILWLDSSLNVFAEMAMDVLERKNHYSAETMLCTLNGRRLDTLFTVSCPPQNSRLRYLLIGIIDVTEAKKARLAQDRSERRYRDFFHFLPVPLLHLEGRAVIKLFDQARMEGVTDFAEHMRSYPEIFSKVVEGLKIVEVNQRTVEMFRAGSSDDFIGSVTRYWTESPDIFCDVMGARFSGKPGYQAQVKMKAHDGTVLDALFFAAFGPITGERHVSLVGLIDVSDRVKAQEMLAHVQAEIAHAARVSVLGELTASIAHEVSQPLTAIATNTEASLLWLQHSPPNVEEVRLLSARTAAQVQRAAEIIHRIRTMASRANPEHKPVELNPLIEEAVLFLRHELQRSDIDTSLKFNTGLPLITGDRVQLQQVIVNLAINAIQAMVAAGSSSRLLAISTGMASGSEVRIDIEDSGPGFAKDVFDRLFESFFTTKTTGMGIGLPICRSIIEAHGGQISASNRKDHAGAQFTIRLPISQ